jgi:hypothetical protein
MKRILLVIVLALAAFAIVSADTNSKRIPLQPPATPRLAVGTTWLKERAMFAPTEQDMKNAVRISVNGDNPALADLAMQGKLSLPTEKRIKVYLIQARMFTGMVEFRFPGQSQTYWTLPEWVIELPSTYLRGR